MDNAIKAAQAALAKAPDDAATAVLDQIAAGQPYQNISSDLLTERLDVLRGTGSPSDPASYSPAFWSVGAVYNLLLAHGGLSSYLNDARYCCAQL